MLNKKSIEKDIYTKDGKLLLAAGTELTEEMELRLLSYQELGETLFADDRYRNTIKSSLEQIRGNLKIDNGNALDAASEVVIRIIFESKSQPWWLHVSTLSNYIDWVYEHSINVSVISSMLAAALNLKDQQEDIALGALLHDIGKFMIPKSILQRDGAITGDERIFVRQHCDIGVSMLSSFHLNQICLDIIQQHHEKLDGSGYPHGLKGAQIPLHSQIVMIADVLDAITSHRPYRAAKSFEAAIKELREAPEKYPQDIVQIFSSLVLG